MDSPNVKWHIWNRIKLRMPPISQHDTFLDIRGTPLFRYLYSKTEIFMQRLVLLTWIGELDLAKKLWEEEREQHHIYGFPVSFEDFLFRVLIWGGSGGPSDHPEFRNVQYLLLDEEDAFKLSTIPLSELLKMDEPRFSSVDGLITVDFDKHELGRITKIVPEKYQRELRLPLILLRDFGYWESYKSVGTKLENMLLQKILKLTEAPLEKFAEVEEKKEITGISTLRRRRFKTIYKVLPESSTIWLNITYQNPMWKKEKSK